MRTEKIEKRIRKETTYRHDIILCMSMYLIWSMVVPRYVCSMSCHVCHVMFVVECTYCMHTYMHMSLSVFFQFILFAWFVVFFVVDLNENICTFYSCLLLYS